MFFSALARTKLLVAVVIAASWWSCAEAGFAQTSGEFEPAVSGEPGPVVTIPPVDDAPPAGKSLLGILRSGGPVMIPIGIASFILTVFIFERFISLRRGRVIPKPFVTRFIEQLRTRQLSREEAFDLCEANGSAVGEVFAAAVKKWGRPSVEVEQAIIDAGERVANRLRRYLRLFNGISTLSPLLGLLGTVMGMIRSFNTIATADAMGRPELLAAGISEALITTAAGLSVAIPALIAYLFFVGRVDRLIIDLDALGQEVVEQIASDAWQREAEAGPPKVKKKDKAA